MLSDPGRRYCTALVTVLLVLGSACAQETESDEIPRTGPDIRGSYQLTSRDLPDGTTLEPPEVYGFMTYTNGFRHFHIYVPGPDGERASTSFVGTYELRSDQYAETSLYTVANNQPAGSGLTYDVSRQERSWPVTTTGADVQFQDGENGPVLVFTDQGLTATLEGAFVDHWIRVE